MTLQHVLYPALRVPTNAVASISNTPFSWTSTANNKKVSRQRCPCSSDSCSRLIGGREYPFSMRTMCQLSVSLVNSRLHPASRESLAYSLIAHFWNISLYSKRNLNFLPPQSVYQRFCFNSSEFC